MHRSQRRDLVLADRKTKILAVLVSTTPVGTGVWEGGLGCEGGGVEYEWGCEWCGEWDVTTGRMGRSRGVGVGMERR